MKIYDVTIGEIVNECKKSPCWDDCIKCRFHNFCTTNEVKYLGIFNKIRNIEIPDKYMTESEDK